MFKILIAFVIGYYIATLNLAQIAEDIIGTDDRPAVEIMRTSDAAWDEHSEDLSKYLNRTMKKVEQ